MNLGSLITEAQRLAGRVDRDWNARTTRWLNEAMVQWAMAVPWPTLLQTETFVADGTAKLILPPRVLTINWIGDKTNALPLAAGNMMDREDPDEFFDGTGGDAVQWKEEGMVAVTRQPAAASRLVFQTTSSDNFNCFIAGLAHDSDASGTADDYRAVKESVAILSDGAYTTTNSYYQVDILGKDDITPADVTVKTTGGVQVGRISKNEYSTQYRVIRLLPVPDAGTQLWINYVRRPEPMQDTYEVPPPAVDSEYLIWYAAAMIHNAQGQTQEGEVKKAHADEIVSKRIYKEKMHGDKDLRAFPEYQYWNHDDQYLWPESF